MSILRYALSMEDRIPASQITVFGRGGIVNGAQSNVTTVTVHAGHDFIVGHKFLYALTRVNILTGRIFTITGKTDTTISFTGAATFTDKCLLVPLGTDTGGVVQPDGTFSRLNWDGSPLFAYKDPHGDAAYTSATVPVEPGGEAGFWSDSVTLWAVARNTQGNPLRVYIAAQSDSSGDVTTIVNEITNIQNDITNITNEITNITNNITEGAATATPSAVQTLLLQAYGWYRADSIVAANLNGGVIADAALVNSWYDSSGNANHLTAHGVFGDDTNDAASRPVYRTIAGGFSGNSYLPLVQLAGTTSGGGGTGHHGYFTIDTGTFSVSASAGWTVFLVSRDYAIITQSDRWLGSNTSLGDASVKDALLGAGGGSNSGQFSIDEGASNKAFSQAFAHTDGSDTEIIGVRALASTAALECWVDGVHQTATGDTRLASAQFRYIGSHLAGVGSRIGTWGKGLYEMIIFQRALTDAEMTTINSYLLDRVGSGAGSLLTAGIPRNIGTWNINAVTDGTDTACSNGTAYCGSIFVPANMKITGIQYLVGSVGGTNNVIASLHSSTGALVAASTQSGTTVGTAAQIQLVPFTAPFSAVGPSWYFVALTFNGTTAKFRTVPLYCNAGNGVIGNGVTQTYGTSASFTAPTTFNADKVPVASIY